MTPVLLDTGVIVSLLDRSERFHNVCAEIIESIAAPLVSCEAVISESCYLLRRSPGAAEAVIQNVISEAFRIPFQLPAAAPRIERILRKYRDRGIDFADACLIDLAGELRTGDILTLDHDFQIYRWSGNKRFNLLVSLD